MESKVPKKFLFSIFCNSCFFSSKSPSLINKESSFFDLGDFDLDFDFLDNLSLDLFALEDFDLSLSLDDFFEDFFDALLLSFELI